MLLTVVAALTVCGYLYFCLDDEICRQVERRLCDHYTNFRIQVGRARFEQDHGIAIYNVRLAGSQSGGSNNPIIAIDELHLAGKMRVEELVADRMRIREIIVRRPTLRACRLQAGSWNIETLLPLPQLSEDLPAIRIENAVLCVEDTTRSPPIAQTVQGINLTLTPIDAADSPIAKPSKRFRVAGTVAGLPAHQVSVEGEVDASNGNYNLLVNIAGLAVTPELIATLPGIEATELRDADVSGRLDATLRVSRTAADQQPDWSVTIRADRGRIAHPSWPEPLSEMSFVGTADARRLRIQQLNCRCGPASVALAGERAGWNRNAPLAVAARITNLPVNERLFGALSSACGRAWQRFQPIGLADAEVQLTFDGRQWRPQVAAVCRDLSLTDAQTFPYRLEQTSGRIDYRPAGPDGPDKLTLDLTGFGAGRPVRIRSELSSLAQTKPLGWIEVSGAEMPLHEQLLAALPEKAEHLVRSLRPQGAVDFRFRAEWSNSSEQRAEITQDIRLKNCDILYEMFPYPLRQVQGLVTFREGKWTLHDVEGTGWNDSTRIVCRGESLPQDGQHRTDINLQATNVSLDDNLKLALPSAIQQAWEEFRPQGRVDFLVHALCEPGRPEPRIEVVLKPRERSVSIEPVAFPYRLDQFEGEAAFDAGGVRLSNVIARHEGAVYSAAAGLWQPVGGGWRLLLSGVNADRLTPRSDLVAALPPDWQRMIERLQLSGTFGVYNSRLSFAKGASSNRVAAEWDVNLDCHQANVRGELPPASMTGGIHLTGRYNDQTAYAAGELALDTLIWKDVQLTNIRGPLWFDSTVCHFGEAAAQKQSQPPRRITADAYGGSLAANVEIQHEATPNYKLDLALGGADLTRFANERLGGPQDITGTVSGRLVLTGVGQSTQSLRGQGELAVVDANIYELPILVAMLKVLHNRTPNTTAFNRCDMQFGIQGDRIHFEKLNLLGDAVSLYGKGDSDFQRRLDLVFYTLLEPMNLPIPLWKTIAGQVSQQTLQLKVVGTWENAQVQPQTLPGFNQVLEQIQAGAANMAPSTAAHDSAIVPR